MEIVATEVAKLELKPGDAVVVKVEHWLSNVQRDNLKSVLESVLPGGVKALVLDGGADIVVLSGGQA